MTSILITGANGFIGTHFVAALRTYFSGPYQALLVDKAKPHVPLQENESWHAIDIMDRDSLRELFQEFRPDIVVNFAAHTSTDPRYTEADYAVNITGAQQVYQACADFGGRFLVQVSSQFVHQGEGLPQSDQDFAPHTVYGESKVKAENLLRQGGYGFGWCIVRPTNVWGPWHIRYPHEFWRVLKEGKYLHPGRKKVIRSYGYVGNVCWQMVQLIQQRNSPAVNHQVFYVGEQPMPLYDWANAFSLGITGKNVRVVPGPIVYALAAVGTGLYHLGVSFPITLSRYRSMTTHNPAPMDKTLNLLGHPPYSLQEGVDITVKWLKSFWGPSKAQP